MSGYNHKKNHWDEDEELPSLELSSPNIMAPIFDADLREFEALIEQTHQLYQQFFTGSEKRVPIEKQQRIESKIAELNRSLLHGNIVTSTQRFRVQQLLQRYQSFKDLWERKSKEKGRKAA